MDKYDLYERCVQQPELTVRLLEDLHGGRPLRLAEDFCGSGAVSRAWVASDPLRSAVGLDADLEVLTVAQSRLVDPPDRAPRVHFTRAELGGISFEESRSEWGRFDISYAGNFSIGELRDRDSLVRYLRSCRARLSRGGICACDTYGGRNAYQPGSLVRTLCLESATPETQSQTIIRYCYEQVSGDPISARVENHLHFDVIHGGELEQRLHSAFVYLWRLWSVPELRDAMREAGFEDPQVRWTAEGEAPAPQSNPPETFAALVFGRSS